MDKEEAVCVIGIFIAAVALIYFLVQSQTEGPSATANNDKDTPRTGAAAGQPSNWSRVK